MDKRIQTPISGITTTSTHEDGSTCSLVNLRPKNGALHPVPPRKTERELSQEYDIVFIHKNNDYENWIGVVNEERMSAVYWDVRDTSLTGITSIQGVVNSVQQIGNSVTLICEDNIYYLLYRDENYTFLGELPQLSAIKFGSSYTKDVERTFGSNTSISTVRDTIKARVYEAMEYLDKQATWDDGTKQGIFLYDAHFIRYAFRLHDGTLTKHSPPVLILPPIRLFGQGEDISGNLGGVSMKNASLQQTGDNNTMSSASSVTVTGYKVSMNYNFAFTDYENWQDIIKSVDIFLSPPLGLSNIENIRDRLFIGSSGRPAAQSLIMASPQADKKKIITASTFYFVKSIPLGSRNSGLNPQESFPTSSLDIAKMENLIHQEVMTDDSFSHHKTGAKHSYTYNNRLHMAYIKTTMFKGFGEQYFSWGGSQLNGVPAPTSTSDEYGDIFIEVQLDIDGQIATVRADPSVGYFANTYPLFDSAFISYPDPRAKNITFYVRKRGNASWRRVFSAQLTPHEFLNLAYYVTPDLSPIMTALDVSATAPSDNTVTIVESNKIRVSELNNPFTFPVKNTYQAGDGEVLAMATNKMNVSDRNYGQYPLYIFTTAGVWTLNVGAGDVAYSTLSSPISMETPTLPAIGETPYGVVFATQRGLMIINGQSVAFLSPQIEQTPPGLAIETNAHCDGVVFLPEREKFADMLKRLSGLVYDPCENELIVNTPGRGPNYVYDFDSKSFYQSTEKFDLVVGNTYPDLFVVDGRTVKNYAAAESPLAHVGFITRPMNFGTPDIKRFERMILRGLFRDVATPLDGKFPLFMLHYSMDRVNFKALTGYPIPVGNVKDLDSGLLARAKSPYIMFTLAGVMSEESEIKHLDTIVDKEYDNTKMR